MSREIYGLLIGIITLAITLLPLPLFTLAVGLLSLLIAREVSVHLGVRDLYPAGFFSPLIFYVDASLGTAYAFLMGLAYGYRRWNLDSMMRAVFLLTYVGFFPSYLIGIKVEGTMYLITFLLSIWALDVAAYYVGKNLGRRSLFPRISPNKTAEGFVGGILVGTLVFLALSPMGLLRSVLTALLFLTAGVCGDYLKSFLKRQFGIKDFSNILGSHGGFTDRFDAVLFSAPIYFWLLFRS